MVFKYCWGHFLKTLLGHYLMCYELCILYSNNRGLHQEANQQLEFLKFRTKKAKSEK